MKKNTKYLLLCITIVFLGACFLYLPYLINQVPFELSTIDTREQNFAFYNELKNIIQNFLANKQLAFYSWSDFLGSSFLISKSFYGATDIFTLISCILNLEFWDSLMIMQIAKCMVACVGMYYLLNKIEVSNFSKVIGAIVYPFCASMCYFTVYPHFTTFFSLLPLFLLSFEYAMFNKKYLSLTFMTAFLAFTNYYFFFILVFFTIIYFIFRYINYYGILMKKNEIKKLIICVLNLILSCAIGAVIASFILYPVFLYVLQNERVGAGNYGLFFKDYKIYFQIISSLFLPIHAYKGLHYSFVPSSYAMYENYFWASSLLILLFPLSFQTKDKKKKISYLFVFIIFFIVVCIPFINAVVHGFGEPSFRITAFFQIILIIIISQTIDDFSFTKKYGAFFLVLFVIITSSLFIIPTVIDQTTQATNPKIYFLLLITLMFIIIEISLLLLFHKRKIYKYLLLIVVVIEILLMWKTTINRFFVQDDRHSYKFMNNATHAMGYNKDDLKNYLDSIDEENSKIYYRVYFDDVNMASGIGKNVPLFYGINSIMTYDSLFSPSLQKLVELDPSMIKGSTHYLSITNHEVLKFVNVKYALVKNETELPEKISWKLIEDNYLNWISVYENEDYIPLGRTYGQLITYENYTDVSDLNGYIICKSEDFNEISKYLTDETEYLENIFYKNNTLIGEISSSSSGFMLVTLPYDKGWSVKVNNEYAQIFNVNGGFMGFAIPQGKSEVVLYYMPDGLKEGIILSLLGIITCFVVQLLRKKRGNVEDE